MKGTLSHIAGLAALVLSSCTSFIEKMDKGTPTGDHYLAAYHQLGGQGVVETSMGSRITVDNVKSFGDFVSALIARWGFNAQTKGLAIQAKENMFREGQLTLRQAQEIEGVIAGATTAKDLQLGLAAIGKK